MRPQVTIPMLSVVDADAARRAPNGTPAGSAMPILVDVRERHEFAAIRAPGAVLYPTSSFLLRCEELPRDRPIHVVCQSGSRSAAVTAFLLRKGWTDVSSVAGGMDAWARAGLEVRRGPLAPGEGDLGA
jgi:rhodanese-related sulfurtransferase